MKIKIKFKNIREPIYYNAEQLDFSFNEGDLIIKTKGDLISIDCSLVESVNVIP